jgi:two-component system, sensor histidine kinase PdtaS
LATNSFKYAFENIEKGVIDVKIKQFDKMLQIDYADNGKGLQTEFDLSKGGFGFKVLSILSQQLNATIKYRKTEKYSLFSIEIKLH